MTTTERWQDRITQLDWRAWLHAPTTPIWLATFGTVLWGSLAVFLTPAPYNGFVSFYVTWMLVLFIGSLPLHTRWWLTWLAGTLLFETGLLVAWGWQLMQMAHGCP